MWPKSPHHLEQQPIPTPVQPSVVAVEYLLEVRERKQKGDILRSLKAKMIYETKEEITSETIVSSWWITKIDMNRVS